MTDMLQTNIESVPTEIEEIYDELEETPDDVASDVMAMFIYQVNRRLKELGWNQKDLAEAMEVKPPQVSQWLKAENTTLLTIAKVAHALKLAFRSIKFVPANQENRQIDEVKAFVRGEASHDTWWPTTCKRWHFHGFEKASQFGQSYGGPPGNQPSRPESAASKERRAFFIRFDLHQPLKSSRFDLKYSPSKNFGTSGILPHSKSIAEFKRSLG